MVSGFFTKKIAHMQSVGDILGQRRISLGVDVVRVANETGIQAHYLDAIEKNDLSKLPAEIYVRGFVRTYADYLRLDVDQVIEQWDRERGIARHMDEVDKSTTPLKKQHVKRTFPDRKPLLPRIKLTPLVVRSGLIGLIIVAGLLYIILAVSELGRRPVLSLTEPTSDIKVEDGAIVVVGETLPEAQLTINGQAVQVSGEGNFRETVNLQAGMNQIKIVARSKLGRETEITRNIQANLEPVASLTDPDSSNDSEKGLVDTSSIKEVGEEDQQGPVDVTVEINDEATWIAVNVDGKSTFEGTLLPNSSKRFVGQESVVLTSGKAQHTAVRFKGKELQSLGEGFLRDITFTPDIDLQDLSTTASSE